MIKMSTKINKLITKSKEIGLRTNEILYKLNELDFLVTPIADEAQKLIKQGDKLLDEVECNYDDDTEVLDLSNKLFHHCIFEIQNIVVLKSILSDIIANCTNS